MGVPLVLGAVGVIAVAGLVRRGGSLARHAIPQQRYTIEVSSGLFRESGANATTDKIIASYAKKMKGYGGWGKFPPVLGQVGAVDLDDVEEYEEADEAGHAHELAWSRPITRRDVGKQFVLLSDGHHRSYAASRLKIPILVAPYHGYSGQPWTPTEVAEWWAEYGGAGSAARRMYAEVKWSGSS